MRYENFFIKNLKGANRTRVIITLKSDLKGFLINFIDMTLYVFQLSTLMWGMPIGKNVEYMPANRDIPKLLNVFLRFIYDLRYFISMYLRYLNADRQ